jgi:hypothetical protein
VKQHPITQALVDTLDAAGITVGEGVADENGGWDDGFTSHQPYAVVFPIAGGTRTGTLADHEDSGSLVYQVTCVAPTMFACERLVDDVSVAVRQLTGMSAGGLRVTHTRNDFGSHQVRRADDVEPAEPLLFYGTPRFRVWVTPEVN